MHFFKNSLSSVFLGILLVSGALFAEEPMTHEQLPASIDLGGTWQFTLAENEKAARAIADFYDADFDRSSFSAITVPGHWTAQGFEEPHYVNGTESEGFYHLTFDAPESLDGLRAILQFDGVWVSAEVWLNGENLGRHDSGFTAFEFDVTDELQAGENTLAVRVRQQIPASLFKFDANDDWGLPGIYRGVRINFTPKHLYIANVEVSTDLDSSYTDAELDVRVMVIRSERDHYIDPCDPFDVRSRLYSREGELLQEFTKSIQVAGGSNGTDARLVQLVRSPDLWTAETPNLYRLEVAIVREGAVIHQWEDLIGFREVSTVGGIFRVNGRAVKLRGVASHDLHPDVGRATTEAHWRKDISLMKEANINTVRLAHYPHAEGFIRLCDELGLYVIDEIPLGFGGDRMEDPIFASGMFLRIHETILRDRNRPSVIVWSFGNEDGLTYLHTVGLRTIKGIDPTRPILLPFRAEPWLPEEVDILAPHYWKTNEYDQLGAAAQRPVVTTEYTHALGESLGELEARWDALTRHPAGAGGMIWLWADQGLLRNTTGQEVADPMEDKDKYTREGSEFVRESKPRPGFIIDAHGNYGTDGIVTSEREPTRDYLEAKAVYAPVRISSETVMVDTAAQAVFIPVVNGFDFTDLSSVMFDWEWNREGRILSSGTIRLEAAPHTTANLEIPAEETVGDSDYIEIFIIRPDGSTMATESVRVLGDPSTPLAGAVEVSLEEGPREIVIGAGRTRYVFGRDSGELERIEHGGELLVEGIRPVVWRPSTYNERNRYDRRDNQHDWNTYMQDLSGELLRLDVEHRGDEVEVSSTCLYVEDDLNQLRADIVYTVGPDGVLRTDVRLEVTMDIPELPETGFELDLGTLPEQFSWLGEGPYSSVPGKTAATRFGWWSFAALEANAGGTKTGLDWAALGFSSGTRLVVDGAAGVRLNTDGSNFRVLTRVGGDWTKNGPPENPRWHLNLETQTVYEGSFNLRVED